MGQIVQRSHEGASFIRTGSQDISKEVGYLLLLGTLRFHFPNPVPEPIFIDPKFPADGGNNGINRNTSPHFICCDGVLFEAKPVSEALLGKTFGFAELFDSLSDC